MVGQALACLAAACLAACSSEESSDWSSLYQVARNYWNGPPSVTLEQAGAIPYATLGVRLGDSSQIVLVLATDNAGEQLWTASGQIAIKTRGGRIVQSSGFANDLSGYAAARDLAGRIEDWGAPHTWRWSADFADIKVYAAPVECRDTPAGREAIIILGKQISVLRVDESCHCAELGWGFENTYWVDPASGLVWQSIQNIHPNLDPVELSVLRPIASG